MEKEHGCRKIIWYGIPAYGHVYSNLYLVQYLSEHGFYVIYYSMEEFREVIESHGAKCCIYPIREGELDLTDGRRILKLYRLSLQYTENMMPFLWEEAVREQPCGVIFDSLALWGRIIGGLFHVPCFSFYSIAAMGRAGGKGFFEYIRGFSGDFLCYAGEIPQSWKIRKRIAWKWKCKGLGMISVLMGQGDWNLMGYSRLFQPGGKGFGEKYRFLGPLAVYRQESRNNDFICKKGKVIYISLGTIFNQDKRLMGEIMRQFGRNRTDRGTVNEKVNGADERQSREYFVVMVWNGMNEGEQIRFPDNFIVRRFVNQKEVMKQACLFISAGGLNSIHEALYFGVPCLLCPQQGEQLLIARRLEKLGFGKILKDPEKLREEAEMAMGLKKMWDEEKRRKMTEICTEQMDEICRRM